MLALCKYHHFGALIGEESGGTYRCNANQECWNLKNSLLELWCPKSSFAVTVKGLPLNRGILPDYPIEWSVADLIAGKDTVKEFALNLL